MQRHLYLDIETIPAQRPDVMSDISASLQSKLDADIAAVKPPGNYKKQETIDSWMAEEQPKAVQALRDCFDADVDAAYRKTGLDGAFGQVCVIGWALDDGECNSEHFRNYAGINAEKELFSIFHEQLANAIPRADELSTTIIGHNVANFDLRFLVQRHIVNGIRPHGIIARASQAKPWETDRVYDTMVQWAGIGRTISLDRLCKALSVPTPKGCITGATVWDEVKAGRIDDVAAYCAADVNATREVHKRLTFAA